MVSAPAEVDAGIHEPRREVNVRRLEGAVEVRVFGCAAVDVHHGRETIVYRLVACVIQEEEINQAVAVVVSGGDRCRP